MRGFCVVGGRVDCLGLRVEFLAIFFLTVKIIITIVITVAGKGWKLIKGREF